MTEATANPRVDKKTQSALAQTDHSLGTDWVGYWFKLVETTVGEYVGMRAGRPSPDGFGIAWLFRPHYDYDGAGGLVQILREETQSRDIQVPVLKGGATPSRLWRTMALLRFFAKKRRAAAPWKTLDLSWSAPVGGIKGPGTNLATYSFDAERTSKLSDKARAAGVSVNSFLFSAMARVSEPELEAGPAMWMMPVNMRGLVPVTRDTGNYTAYLYIEVDRGSTAARVHDAVKRATQRGEHRATPPPECGQVVGRRVFTGHTDGMEARLDGRAVLGASPTWSWDWIGPVRRPPGTFSCPARRRRHEPAMESAPERSRSIVNRRQSSRPQALMDRFIAERRQSQVELCFMVEPVDAHGPVRLVVRILMNDEEW